MSIFRTAYDTSACKGYVLTKVRHGVEEVIARSYVGHIEIPDLKLTGWSGEPLLALVADTSNTMVPAFAYPIERELSAAELGASREMHDRTGVVTDLRPYTKAVRDGAWDIKDRIGNPSEYNLHASEAVLTYYWLNNEPQHLLTLSKLPMQIYADWISQQLRNRYSLDPNEQMKVAVISAFFYNCLFVKEGTIGEHEKYRLAGAIARAINVSADVVVSILQNVEQIDNVEGLCNAIKDVLQNVRLEGLTHGMLYEIVGRSWYGNSVEAMAIALEHPPTWIAYLRAACTDRSYKNTFIQKLLQHKKASDLDQFTKAFHNILVLTCGRN